jgi:hypothetical protein
METKKPNNEAEIKTVKSTNYFGRSKEQLIFDLIKWLVGVLAIVVSIALAWGKLETVTHSEETYVRKDMFIEFQKSNEKSQDEMKAILKEIRQWQMVNKNDHR